MWYNEMIESIINKLVVGRTFPPSPSITSPPPPLSHLPLHATVLYFPLQGPDKRQLYLGELHAPILPEYNSDFPAPIVLPSGVVPDAGVVPAAGPIAPAPLIPPAPAILPADAIKEKNKAYSDGEGCHFV